MTLKPMILCGIAIFVISCRDAGTVLDAEVQAEQVEILEEKDVSETLVASLSKLPESGMMIEEAKELLSKVDIKQKVLKKDDLMRVYFFPEQEKSGDLVAIDLHLSGDLITDCKFGYRK